MSPASGFIRRVLDRCTGPLCAGLMFIAGLLSAGLLYAVLTAVTASAHA